MPAKNNKLSLVYKPKYSEAFRRNRPLHLMIILFIAVFIILSLKPVDRFEWWFENITSLITVILLTVTYNKNRLTGLSYACVLICLILHALGAHFTYLNCPIGNWMKVLFGFRRNNYDRLVGFSFGLLVSFPVMESLYQRLWLRYIHACILSGVIILSVCAMFQLYEMYCSMLLTPKHAFIFLGIQSDIWDAQNDIAAGFIGSVVSMGGCIMFRVKKNHNIHIVRNDNK